MPQNIAQQLSEEQLKKIGIIVVEEYKADLASRFEWEARAENWLKLFSGYRDPKSFPWPDASNVCVPLLGVASLQFNARALDSIVPAKGIAKCYATDGQAIERAARVDKHFNWQLTEDMDSFEDGMDELLMLLPIYGSAFKKTYYDEIERKPVSLPLSVYEFVVPYKTKRLNKCPRCTHAFEEYLNDIKIKAQQGVYVAAAMDLKPGVIENPDKPGRNIQRTREEIEGERKSNFVEQPRLILEQHRFLDLDEDGIQEPYIVTVDDETAAVLSIQPRWYMDQLTGQMKSLEYFTDYSFIKNPESVYGYGFGHFLEHLNESANAIINQLIDAGTLNTTICGILNKRSGVKKGHLQFQMGQFIEADVTTDDIRKALYQFDFKEPSAVLFNLLGLIVNYAKEISSVSDSMLGKMPPSDTTATSMMAVLEQGLKVYSTIHKRIHRSFKRELKKIFFIDSQTLDERVYFEVQDSTSGDMIGYESGRADYSNMIDVMPVSDPNITSKAEKLLKAKTVYETALTNPLINSDREKVYNATRKYLEANEVQNVDQYIDKEPPAPPDLSPTEENALFIQEKDSVVLPQQDHVKHLKEHMIFQESAFGQDLTPQGKKLLENHLLVHKSYDYMNMQRMLEQAANPAVGAEEMMAGMGMMQ